MSRKKISISELNLNKIGARISYIRLINGEKQAQFAQKTGLYRGNLSSLESSKYEPSYQAISKILKIYQVNSDWLLFGEGEYSSVKDQITKKNLHDLTDNDKARISDIAKSSETDKLEKSERIRFVRNQLNLTQDDFGSPIGLKQANVRDLEAGKVNISTLHALAIENIYGISSEWLLTGEGEMFVQSSQQEARQEHPKPIDKETEIKQLLKQTEQVLKSDNQMISDNLKQNIEQSSYTLEIEAQLNSFKKKSRE